MYSLRQLIVHGSLRFLKGLVPSFVKCADSLIEKLQKSADGKTPVPMKLELSNVTLDIISKVHFIMLVIIMTYECRLGFHLTFLSGLLKN